MSLQDMTALKDWTQLVVWVIGIAGGIFGLYKACEIRENRKQRLAELQWKRSNAAKELVDDIHRDQHGVHAVQMLEWCTEKEGQELRNRSRAPRSHHLRSSAPCPRQEQGRT